jgi:hypothetical protein
MDPIVDSSDDEGSFFSEDDENDEAEWFGAFFPFSMFPLLHILQPYHYARTRSNGWITARMRHMRAVFLCFCLVVSPFAFV